MAALSALLLLAAGPAGALPDPLPPGTPCPTEHHRPRSDGTEVCFGEAGPNFAFAFVYPAEAAREPALDARLRHDKDVVRAGFQEIIDLAHDYPDDRFIYEEAYALDAGTAELVALSGQVWEQAGGEVRRTGNGVLVWDRAAGAAITPEELFTDRDALALEIRRLACPALAAIRPPGSDEECIRPGYDLRPVAGADRPIDRLRIIFDDLDEDGGGEFQVRIPVTPRLLALIQPRYRASFANSGGAATVCNPALPAHPCPVD